MTMKSSMKKLDYVMRIVEIKNINEKLDSYLLIIKKGVLYVWFSWAYISELSNKY